MFNFRTLGDIIAHTVKPKKAEPVEQVKVEAPKAKTPRKPRNKAND